MSNTESLDGESPMILWLQEHGKKVIMGFAILLLVLFILFRLYSGSQAKAEKDFMEANKLAVALFQSAKANEALEKLSLIVQREPTLQTEYDGLMAQAYLNQNQVEKASTLTRRMTLRLAKDPISPYLESSSIALSIAEGKDDEAYPKALHLKENLKNEPSLLYFFNLLRIGMLEERLGKKEEEKKTWDEFLSFSGQPVFQQFIDGIDSPGASVVTFIQERQKKLKG